MKRKYVRITAKRRRGLSLVRVNGPVHFQHTGAEAFLPLAAQLSRSLPTITTIPQTIYTYHAHAQMLNYLGKE